MSNVIWATVILLAEEGFLKYNLSFIFVSATKGLVRLCCATSPKDAGPISDDVFWSFHWYKLSGRTFAQGSNQSPQKWVSEIYPGG